MKDFGRLVLGFRSGDVFTIGDDVAIMLDKVGPGTWRIRFNAPKDLKIRRVNAGESVSDKGPQTFKRNPRAVGSKG